MQSKIVMVMLDFHQLKLRLDAHLKTINKNRKIGSDLLKIPY